MQLDRRTINKLLSLNDEQLKAVIGKLANESGLDLSGFNISANDIAGIRMALSMASDEDIKKAAEQLGNLQRKQR